ncbi:MAG: hypothetical protein Q7R40_17870, partial [Phaeospirillum sp.]|nr:hypothetical protein [Phaeospirillum sp.]
GLLRGALAATVDWSTRFGVVLVGPPDCFATFRTISAYKLPHRVSPILPIILIASAAHCGTIAFPSAFNAAFRFTIEHHSTG